jgi:hypothetical protein
MTASEYVTHLKRLNGGLAYALKAHDFVNFQDMVDKALVHENQRGIMGWQKEDAAYGSSRKPQDVPGWFFLKRTYLSSWKVHEIA